MSNQIATVTVLLAASAIAAMLSMGNHGVSAYPYAEPDPDPYAFADPYAYPDPDPEANPEPQSINPVPSNVEPYRSANKGFGESHRKYQGRPLSSHDTNEFKPYNSAFDRGTAEKLSNLGVNGARRFGPRG